MSLHVSDVLDHLICKGLAPSTLGAQLERLKYGVQLDQDPFRARQDAEDRMLAQAELIRFVDDFTRRIEFAVPKQRLVVSSGYQVLDKLQKASSRGQGEIAISILRAYHERSTQSMDRGLYEVYKYLTYIAPKVIPPPPKDEDLLEAFRKNTAKKSRNFTAEAYADSLLALQRAVHVWNKKK